jgi:predicted deacetylase
MEHSKYIFRVDDVAPNMDWYNFHRLKDIFIKYDIKPLIGVIPENQDPYLKSFDECTEDFWEQIRLLHHNLKWPIALHGYNHVYTTNNEGILKIHKRSEFAGLNEKEQNDKIVLGKLKLEIEQLEISAFMAPSHSFDETTLKVLSNNNIGVITDGFGIYPFKWKSIIFIPQLFATPRKMPYGVYTWCLHLNSFTDNCFEVIENFVRNNQSSIISFDEAKLLMANTIWQRINNCLVRILMNIRLRIRSLTRN